MKRVLRMGCGLAIIAGWLAGTAGAQAIYSACELGQVDRVKTFLDKDPSLANSKDNNGFAPLHWAAGGGSRDVTAVLLAKGADVNARNDFGATPLHLAAFMGRNDVVELLLAKGADVNAVTVSSAARTAAGVKYLRTCPRVARALGVLSPGAPTLVMFPPESRYQRVS